MNRPPKKQLNMFQVLDRNKNKRRKYLVYHLNVSILNNEYHYLHNNVCLKQIWVIFAEFFSGSYKHKFLLQLLEVVRQILKI